ncbi:MAG TPA: class I SAM-dependent methyltransferase [Thermoanaerobaculia bacterium]
MTDAARLVAEQFGSPFLRSYARSKLKIDPVYPAVLELLRGSTAPLYDIGCGVGLLEFFLRASGFPHAITGIDHDARKVAKANELASRYSGLEFRSGDARDPVPSGTNVVLIDVLHYFSDADQRLILASAAAAVPPRGIVIIRDAVRDNSLRYRITVAQEGFSRAVHWLRAERLNFPTRDTITSAFDGFEAEVVPMWGRTPFNNYLFVFRRSGAGTTKR